MANIIKEIIHKVKLHYQKYKTYRHFGDKTYYHVHNGKNIFVKGTYSYGVPDIYPYDNPCNLYIGNYCSIGKGCEILLGGNHHTNWVTTFAFCKSGNAFPKWWDLHKDTDIFHGNIHIGDDVWIGRNVLILPGANIGNGAVIGAGSVVAGKIPAYSIAVGNPCRVIKMRFSDNQIQALERISWWEWDPAKINENLHLLCNENIYEFIK